MKNKRNYASLARTISSPTSEPYHLLPVTKVIDNSCCGGAVEWPSSSELSNLLGQSKIGDGRRIMPLAFSGHASSSATY